MIKINYRENFIKQFKNLPREIKEKLAFLEDVFVCDNFNPVLHTKKLKGSLKNFFSFRITRDYRVLYRFVSHEEVDFLSVKHRKDIYKNA